MVFRVCMNLSVRRVTLRLITNSAPRRVGSRPVSIDCWRPIYRPSFRRKFVRRARVFYEHDTTCLPVPATRTLSEVVFSPRGNNRRPPTLLTRIFFSIIETRAKHVTFHIFLPLPERTHGRGKPTETKVARRRKRTKKPYASSQFNWVTSRFYVCSPCYTSTRRIRAFNLRRRRRRGGPIMQTSRTISEASRRVRHYHHRSMADTSNGTHKKTDGVSSVQPMMTRRST